MNEGQSYRPRHCAKRQIEEEGAKEERGQNGSDLSPGALTLFLLARSRVSIIPRDLTALSRYGTYEAWSRDAATLGPAPYVLGAG